MAFVTIKGFKGKIFIPDADPSVKRKCPCADCFSCQFCSDEKCAMCIGTSSFRCSSRRGTCEDDILRSGRRDEQN